MDILYFRPNSCQLFRDWRKFKEDKYNTLITEFLSSDPSKPVAYRYINCKYNYNQIYCLERTPLHFLMSDLYQLILWEERVANRLECLPWFLLNHIDYEWGKYRSIEIVDKARENLEDIITACNEIIDFNVEIDLLKAEINKRQSRCDRFEKTQFDKNVWFEYQGFSNERYQVVLRETFKHLNIIKNVLKYLPLLGVVHEIYDVETIINIFENFCSYNRIDELDNSERIKFILWSNVLPPDEMFIFFKSNTTEHRNLTN